MSDVQTPNVRTRVLSEQGAWVEADKPAERLPKTRRFVLTASVPPGTQWRDRGIIAEGVLFSDGAVVVRLRGEQRSTVVYDTIEDVIAAQTAELSWVD